MFLCCHFILCRDGPLNNRGLYLIVDDGTKTRRNPIVAVNLMWQPSNFIATLSTKVYIQIVHDTLGVEGAAECHKIPYGEGGDQECKVVHIWKVPNVRKKHLMNFLLAFKRKKMSSVYWLRLLKVCFTLRKPLNDIFTKKGHSWRLLILTAQKYKKG